MSKPDSADDSRPWILGLAGSRRQGSNSSMLLEAALEGAAAAGARTENVRIWDLNIGYCRACGGCRATGHCVLDDDMKALAQKLRTCDHLILATPVYFLGPPAPVKAIIDRCQQFWEERYELGRPPVHDKETSRALLIAAAATTGPNVFQPIRRIVGAFFALLGFQIIDPVFAEGLEEAGTVAARPDYLDRAREAGVMLVKGS